MSKLTKEVEEAKEILDRAIQTMDEADSAIQALSDDADPEQREFLVARFDARKEDVERAREQLERSIALRDARERIPPFEQDDGGDDDGDGGGGGKRTRISRGGHEPFVYQPTSRHSYFGDLYKAEKQGDEEARQRLYQHGKQMLHHTRDVTTADPGAASLIPPIYLGEQWIDKEIGGRPFADRVPKIPFPDRGKTMTFPRVATAPAAAVQAAEAGAVNEVDLDTEDYEVSKVMIAGQNDVSIQTLLWSDPSIDTVIFRELVKSYNQQLDSQLLAGSGTAGQHRGLRNVSGINTVAFATGGGDDLLGKIYEALSAVAANAPGFEANLVLMHPRRAAWMASHRDANGNLYQQGQLVLAAGQQNRGFAIEVAGLEQMKDSNIATNLGTNTNEDEVYVLDVDELMLAEGPVRTRVLEEVLSGTLQVRIQLYGESIFAGGRRPKVITRISGAGLVPPTFPST